MACRWCKSDCGRKKYCSRRCAWTWHNHNRTLTPNVVGPCVICGKKVSRWESPARRKKERDGRIFCNRTCAGIGRMGKNHPNWTGGRSVDKDGYVLVYAPNHPLRRKNNKILEHRIVAEKHFGVRLKRKNVVHHKNDNPSDNRPKNLKIYPSNKEHKQDDYRFRKISENGRLVKKDIAC